MPSPSSRMCHYCVRCCWDGGQVWLGIATPAVDCRGRTAVKSDSFQSTDKSCLTHWLPPWGLARVWALLQSCCSSCLYFQWKPNQQGFRKEISYRWSDVKMLGTYVWIHGARSLNIGPEWGIWAGWQSIEAFCPAGFLSAWILGIIEKGRVSVGIIYLGDGEIWSNGRRQYVSQKTFFMNSWSESD